MPVGTQKLSSNMFSGLTALALGAPHICVCVYVKSSNCSRGRYVKYACVKKKKAPPQNKSKLNWFKCTERVFN